MNLNDLEGNLGPRATVVADHTPLGKSEPICTRGQKVHLYSGIAPLWDDIKTVMMLVPIVVHKESGELMLTEVPPEILDIPEPYNSLWYQPRA